MFTRLITFSRKAVWTHFLVSLGTLLALFVGLAAFAQQPAASGGEWPMYRHDGHLTARSSGVGELTSPVVTWRFDLRGHRWWIKVDAAETDSSLSLAAGAGQSALTPSESSKWGLDAPAVNLQGNGILKPAPAYAAKFLEDVPGLQSFSVRMIDNERGYCELLAYDQGAPRRVWRSDDFRVFQSPHPVVADANADGQLDVVVCPHYQVAVLDGSTGKTIQQLRWHNGRNYGHLVVKNIDDDPALEICVLGDFYSHLAMIDNNGQDLSLLWRKEIELKIERKAKIVRPRWDPLQDLDGDGRFELVLSLYNDTGDKRWHLVIYDALTGKSKLDLADTILEGLADLDGDGSVELFCTRAEALFIPTSSDLSLLNYRDGTTQQRWEHAGGAWVTAAHRYPLHINSTVAYGNHNVVVARPALDRREFYLRSPARGDSGPILQAWRVEPGGRIKAAWQCVGPADARQLSVEPTHFLADSQGSSLVTFESSQQDGQWSLQKASASVVAHERTVPEMLERWGGGHLIVARLGANSHASVLASAGNRDVVCLDAKANQPHQRWRRQGAAPLIASDFNGDGRRELALLAVSSTGEGQVAVFAADGSDMWRTPIHGFPGAFQPWNTAALTGISCGRFSGNAYDDVIVFARRSTMHSDEGYVLSGKDGKVLWKRDTSYDGGTSWGFGGTPIVAADHNGDGAEDVHSLYPVNYTVVSGRNGQQLIGKSAAGNDIMPGMWAAYSTPTLFDFDGNHSPEMVWTGPYCIGITDLAGRTRWAMAPEKRQQGSTPQAYPVDWTGNGQYSLLAIADGTLLCFDPITGEPQWRFTLPGAARAAIGDVDGDGRDEAVVLCGAKLIGVSSKQGKTQTDWTVELSAQAVDAVLADSDGDGKLEIVVLTADGFLSGIDQPND